MAVSDETLEWLQALSDAGDPPPWKAIVEGRDQDGGSTFVMVGLGHDRGDDLYIDGEGRAAGEAELDLLAAARTYLPLLVEDVLALRGRRAEAEVSLWMLDRLQALSDAAAPAPWEVVVNQDTGVGFIRVGDGTAQLENLRVSRESVAAERGLLELIAAARTYLPVLIAEIKELHGSVVDLAVVDEWIGANAGWLVGVDLRLERSAWTDKPAVSIQFDSEDRMSQFTLWVSGEAELERAADGEMLAHRYFEGLDAEAVRRVLAEVLAFVRPETR